MIEQTSTPLWQSLSDAEFSEGVAVENIEEENHEGPTVTIHGAAKPIGFALDLLEGVTREIERKTRYLEYLKECMAPVILELGGAETGYIKAEVKAGRKTTNHEMACFEYLAEGNVTMAKMMAEMHNNSTVKWAQVSRAIHVHPETLGRNTEVGEPTVKFTLKEVEDEE